MRRRFLRATTSPARLTISPMVLAAGLPVPADPVPESASTYAVPNPCAPRADQAPLAPWPHPSGWDAAWPPNSASPMTPCKSRATKPLMARVPAYPIPETKLHHRMLIALIIKHKAQLLFHNTARFPRHNDGCNAFSLRCSVGDALGLFRRTSARSVPKAHPPTPPPFTVKL